ncbi:MAG: hypothetical protein H6506_00120 [Calditrichaeota bacterium]|nr:hypothetical protein [Calditrichota bacterium]MCB9391044.1 hypothetical protein [Calditrichota bacterium]
MAKNTEQDVRLEAKLRKAHLLSEEQLALVQELQVDSELGLSEALVQLDLLSSMEIERILASGAETRTIRLEDVALERDAIRQIPAKLAFEKRCIPVRRSGNTLVVAAADPHDESLWEALIAVTDYDVVMLAAEPEALEHALYIHYGSNFVGTKAVPKTALAKQHVNGNPWGIPEPWCLSFETLSDHQGIRRGRELAKQLASETSEPINIPVLLVGPSGCGRTHILEAIKRYRSAKNPLARGLLINGSELVERVRDYATVNQHDYLRFELRDRDIVLIDDAGVCLRDKLAAQEIGALISHFKQYGGAVVLAMTAEERHGSAQSSELQELLSQGTEVEMRAPDQVELKAIALDRNVSEEALTDQALEAAAQSGTGWYGLCEALGANHEKAGTGRHGDESHEN